MWKKKRYDIHIRLSPEDIKALAWTVDYFEPKDELECFRTMRELYWKIHNKCVEINRK